MFSNYFECGFHCDERQESWIIYPDISRESFNFHLDLEPTPNTHSFINKPLSHFFFSSVFHLRLLSAMQVSSPDTEVSVVIKYFYWLARKP